MPIETTPLIFSSKEELEKNFDKVIEEFMGPGICVIRGLSFTKEEQQKLVQTFGDTVGSYPNSSSKNIVHTYLEDHSSSGNKSKITTGDDIMLDWHLEHVDYDSYIPLIGGVWNMFTFKCHPESGKTFFFDSFEAYKLFSPDEIDFLSKCVLTWIDVDDSGPHYAPAIANHWKLNKPLIRIEITERVYVSLFAFDGRTPTEQEQTEYKRLERKFKQIIYDNLDLRIIHRWQEGDIVIPDLFRMAHAVTGGFDPKDRKFNGFWLFAGDLESATESQIPPKWKN